MSRKEELEIEKYKLDEQSKEINLKLAKLQAEINFVSGFKSEEMGNFATEVRDVVDSFENDFFNFIHSLSEIIVKYKK